MASLCYTDSMYLRELFSLEDENKALEDGFLTIRPSGSLRVYNYSDRAATNSESWDNPAVLNSRGLIVDNEDYIVARPWAKFFNHNQPQVGELDYQSPVEVTDKKDGSLGVLFTWDGIRAGISTRGSLDSDQAAHAQKLLDTPNSLWEGYQQGDIMFYGDVTPLVEIVYPGNRIVLKYGDTDTLILLGGVHIDTGRYLSPQETAEEIGWEGQVTEVMPYNTLQEALEAEPRTNAEGLVVRFINENKLVKIKQSDYVTMHRAIFGMNELTVWQALVDGVRLSDLLEPLPDEVHEWVTEIYTWFCDEANEEYDRHTEFLRKLRLYLPIDYSRKDLSARVFLESEDTINPTVIFLIEDGNRTKAYKQIFKNLRPFGGGERPILEQVS